VGHKHIDAHRSEQQEHNSDRAEPHYTHFAFFSVWVRWVGHSGFLLGSTPDLSAESAASGYHEPLIWEAGSREATVICNAHANRGFSPLSAATRLANRTPFVRVPTRDGCRYVPAKSYAGCSILLRLAAFTGRRLGCVAQRQPHQLASYAAVSRTATVVLVAVSTSSRETDTDNTPLALRQVARPAPPCLIGLRAHVRRCSRDIQRPTDRGGDLSLGAR
jgi:hypothetical protein